MNNNKKFENIRNELYNKYAAEYKKNENRVDSLDIAKQFLEEYFKGFPHKTLGKRFKSGLLTEISFYSGHQSKFKLMRSPTRIDKYFKTDFIGIDPITKQKICIDVTNSLSPKLSKINEYFEVAGDLRLINENIQYRIAHFDEKINDCNLSPLMLPIHPEGYIGHYVLNLEGDKYNLIGGLSLLYLDNPNNPSEIIDYDRNIQQYQFFFEKEFNEIYNETKHEVHNEYYEYNNEPSDEEFSKIFYDELTEIVSCSRQFFSNFVRTEVGIALSSIIEPRVILLGGKDPDYFHDYFTTWVHPLKPIKQVFGDIFTSLEDIGGIDILYSP